MDSPDPLLLVADQARPGPANSQIDSDGQYCGLGCASSESHVLFSASLPYDTAALEPPFALHYVTAGALPELTGVQGGNARYHPIWQLGKPPKGEPQQ